ncbi:hypothetical protein, partial [Nostoc commune]|uniref:hypothetical protein n=1 Tax=Nostoc commune TaxID=1178 RepID=UPI001E47DD38
MLDNTARLRRFVGWVERSETQQSPENVGFRSSTQPNTARLRRFVGWVERSETQQSPENVGFRSSTQPTPECFFRLNRAV